MDVRLHNPRFALRAALLAAAMVACAVGPARADCVNGVLPASCVVDATATSPTAPGATGVNLSSGAVYTFTVSNPATTWTFDPNRAPVTADGFWPVGAGQLSYGGLTANYGSLVASAGSTFFPIASTGAVISGLSGALGLMIWDPTPGDNSGSQTVVVAQSADPTLVAGVTVFAKENSLNSVAQGTGGGAVDANIALVASKSYYIHPTSPQQTWSAGPDPSRTTTGEGIDPSTLVSTGLADPAFGPAGLCTSDSQTIGDCQPVNGNVFPSGITGFRFNELVALVNGVYYEIGNGRVLSGLEGELFLLNWDNDSHDNFGFLNVSVNELSTVPEPAAILVLGLGLAALGLARRQRVTT